MPILAPFYPIIFVLLLCTNGIAGIMWYVKSSDAKTYKAQVETCKAKHQAFVDQVEAQGKIAEEKAKQIEEHNRRVADETSKGWAAALDAVRADADRRMRLLNAARSSGSSGVPASPNAAPRVDDPAESLVLSPEQILADCAEDVVKLAWLQDWVRRIK